MSHIRSKDTKPEEIVRKYLFAKGFRYRKNDARYPGKPDIVLPKYHTVIFINGCFWHRHGCSRSTLPKTNQEYWIPKIQRNVDRDQQNIEALEKAGWQVIVIWECELKKKKLEETMSRLPYRSRKNSFREKAEERTLSTLLIRLTGMNTI